MGYLKTTIVGISWIATLRFFSRAITFIRVILLARLLTPTQFGVFGIASLVLAFLETVTETGINIFLIQEKKEIDEYINDAWIISITRGIILGLLIIILSPFIVLFFNSPDSYFLLLLIGIVPFIRGFINPAIITYQKELAFNKEFYLRLTIFLFDSSVVIIFAMLTRSAISFVYGLIAGALLEVILSFIFIRPLPKMVYNLSIIKKILQKGKWVTLYGIFNYISVEGDNLVVGKMLGTGSLGIYQMGYKLSTLPISEISEVINKVTFPVYVRIASDKERLWKAFEKTGLLVTVVSIGFSSIIFFLPQDVFVFILGSAWTEVTQIIRVLVIYGMVRAITNIASSLFFSLERQHFNAGMTFLRLFILGIAIIPLTSFFGILGTSYAVLISALVEIPLVIYYIAKVFNKGKA